MANDVDDAFYARADAHIDLANEQVAAAGRAKVSASFLYAAARFNAWISACGVESAEEMRAAKDEMVEYFVEQYRAALVEHLDDYAGNFDKYMQSPVKDA